MKVKIRKADHVSCAVEGCGREDEGMIVEFKLLGIFNMSFGICERCISKIFRKFRKKK